MILAYIIILVYLLSIIPGVLVFRKQLWLISRDYSNGLQEYRKALASIVFCELLSIAYGAVAIWAKLFGYPGVWEFLVGAYPLIILRSITSLGMWLFYLFYCHPGVTALPLAY